MSEARFEPCMGIGLSMSKTIIEAHNGRLRVEVNPLAGPIPFHNSVR
jgi:signal transduction histidine kinase